MDQEERERLGREVRNVWVEFAREQADPKSSHLIGWDELDEANKEVDRRIGEHIAKLATQHTIAYPFVWLAPKYHYGQQVIIYQTDSARLMLVVGMRFGTFSDSKHKLDGWSYYAVQEWRYQVVGFVNGEPEGRCDGVWYPEGAFAGYVPAWGETGE